MKRLILIALMIAGCAAIPEDRNNYWRMTEHEKAMVFEVMQPMCWENAHVIGFAAGYFGQEAWQGMLAEREKRLEERRKRTIRLEEIRKPDAGRR